MKLLKHLNIGDDLLALLTSIAFNNKFILLTDHKINEDYISDFCSILNIHKVRYYDYRHRVARFDPLMKNVVYEIDYYYSSLIPVNNKILNKGEYSKYPISFLYSIVKNKKIDLNNCSSFNFIINIPSINDYSDSLLKDILCDNDIDRKEEKHYLSIIYNDSRNHIYDVEEQFKDRIEDFIIKYCKDNNIDIYRMKVLYQSLLQLITVNETLKIHNYNYYNEYQLLEIFYRNTNLNKIVD